MTHSPDFEPYDPCTDPNFFGNGLVPDGVVFTKGRWQQQQDTSRAVPQTLAEQPGSGAAIEGLRITIEADSTSLTALAAIIFAKQRAEEAKHQAAAQGRRDWLAAKAIQHGMRGTASDSTNYPYSDHVPNGQARLPHAPYPTPRGGPITFGKASPAPSGAPQGVIHAAQTALDLFKGWCSNRQSGLNGRNTDGRGRPQLPPGPEPKGGRR